MSKTVIRFTLINRKTRTTSPCWVSGATFADGPGYKVKTIAYTRDRAKAARFSTIAAISIAEQYYTNPASVELADGTLLENETAQLRQEQWRRCVKAAQLRQQVSDDFNQFFADIQKHDPALYGTILKALAGAV